MIEGCIVAKLVLGYLKGEGLYRTCSAFQDECPLFHDDNKDLDNVFLTADLKTILDDYSQLREAGRENGLPSSTAVLKSLWKNLDIVIGQLKYATIPSSTPKTSRESQSTRTRRLNYGRARSSVLPKKQESIQSTTSSPSNAQPSAKPSGSNTAEKLPLPRLSPPVNSSPNLSLQSSSKNKTTHLQSTSTRRVTKHGVRSSADKEPANVHRTPSTVQSVGPAVAISSPGAGVETQVFRTTVDVTSTGSTVANSTSDELSRNPEIVEDMFDSVDEGSVLNKEEFSHMGTENKSPPMIVIDNEGSKEQRSLTTEDESLSHLGPSQDESHLRSPKRKGIQPKKRVPQGPSGTSAVNESPVKQVPQPVEVEMDLICSSDSLTPQSFLGTLLSTPLLQEKLAENINKVVGSTRQQSASDELTSSTIQSLTTTEACSDDILPASIQGVGGDIPVKEIMDLMQADPAFDVLFSFFGLDALDALPSAANSTTDSNPCTLLPETSAESSQLVNPTSCVSSPGDNFPDTLGVSPLLEEFQSDSGKEITSALSSASDQQMETPCSSSSSDLHLSATSIVTDALLLLAGSPQKIPPQSQSHLDHSANVLSSGKRNSVTPPKKTPSVQERLNSDDKRPCVDSLPGQAGLITSSFPYVRALDFNLDKGPEASVKRGRKRDIKAKKGAKQATTTTTTTTTSSDKQNKGPLTKKGVRINNKHLEATKSSSSSSSSSSAVASYKNVQAVSSSTVATNVHTGIIQPIPNYGSTDPISSAFIPVVPSSCSTGLPINIHSLTIRPDLAKSSSDALPSTVTYINPVRAPTSSLVTPVNSMSAPVNLTSAVTSHSSSPVDRTNLGTSRVLVNCNNSSTCLNPPTVSFTTCGTVHVSSPSTSANASSVCTTADVNLTPQHTLAVPSTVSFMNPITCPATTSTVNIACSANSHPGHPALPVSLDLSSTSSSNQVVNSTISSSLTGLTQAVLPGHSTDSSVFTSTTRINNSFTCSEQTAGDSNASGASATNSEVVQVATSPLSLQASNLLQSLALQYANTDKNETQNMTSGLDATPLRKERTSGFHETEACSVSESVHGHQALKEKSTSEKNMNLSQESATILSEKHKDNVSVVCETSSPDQLEKVSRDTATVATQLPNSLENKNGSSSTVSIMNQGCRELMKENSSSYLPVYSGTCSEAERQRPSKRRGKRRRDSQQKEKEKKTNSSSRPSKRSKTKAENINFPTDLNVEEFLSKLHYEVK